jgi:hypothetical protein
MIPTFPHTAGALALAFSVDGVLRPAPRHAAVYRALGQPGRLECDGGGPCSIGSEAVLRHGGHTLLVGSVERTASAGADHSCSIRGPLHALERDVRLRQLPIGSPRAIIAELCREAGVEVDADQVPTTPELTIAQCHETALEVVLRCAAAADCCCYEEGGKVVFRPLPLNESPRRLSASDLVGAVTVTTARAGAACEATRLFPESGQVATVRATVDVNATRTVRPSAAVDVAELRARLTAHSRALAGGAVQISGVTTDAGVRPGSVLVLPQGTLASKPMLVVQTIADLHAGGAYECRFVAVPLEQAAAVPVPLTAPRRDLVPGLVLDDRDPDNLGRVLVRATDEPSTSAARWAFVCRRDAGSDHGSFVQPRPQDCVLLEFLGGDPACPVVLGPLYHGGMPAPTADEQQGRSLRILRTQRGTEVRVDAEGNGDRIAIRLGGIDLTLRVDGGRLVFDLPPNAAFDGENIRIHARKLLELLADGELRADAPRILLG